MKGVGFGTGLVERVGYLLVGLEGPWVGYKALGFAIQRTTRYRFSVGAAGFEELVYSIWVRSVDTLVAYIPFALVIRYF